MKLTFCSVCRRYTEFCTHEFDGGVIFGRDADRILYEIVHGTPNTPQRIRTIHEADELYERVTQTLYDKYRRGINAPTRHISNICPNELANIKRRYKSRGPKKFNELVAQMSKEHQRRAKERTAAMNDELSGNTQFCGESPEQSKAFAAYCAALRMDPLPLRTALEQLAVELDCAPAEDRFPAHTRFMQHVCPICGHVAERMGRVDIGCSNTAFHEKKDGNARHNNEISEWEAGYFEGRAFERQSYWAEQKDGNASN